MCRLRISFAFAFCWASVALVGCTRASDSAGPAPADHAASSPLDHDVKDVGKATERVANDIGRATSELANKAGARGEDTWITTKVKSELVKEGFDPVHVHVDTENKVVTLSGNVESAAKLDEAVKAARVSGVVDVKNHLFVKPNAR